MKIIFTACVLLCAAACSSTPLVTSSPNTEPLSQPVEAAATDKQNTNGPMWAISPVARVDGVDIPAADFNREVDRMLRITPFFPPAAFDTFKQVTVERLIDQHLVSTALSTSSFTAKPEETDAEVEAFYKKVGGPEGVREFFELAGITDEDLRNDLARSVVLKKHLRSRYAVQVHDDPAREAQRLQEEKEAWVRELRAEAKIENFAATAIQENPDYAMPSAQ